MFYSGRFRKNQKAAKGFMAAYLRSMRDFEKMPIEEQQKIVAKYFPFKVESQALSTVHVGTDGEVDAGYLSSIQDYSLSAGMIKKKLKPEELYDLSWLEAARAALGPEK